MKKKKKKKGEGYVGRGEAHRQCRSHSSSFSREAPGKGYSL